MIDFISVLLILKPQAGTMIELASHKSFHHDDHAFFLSVRSHVPSILETSKTGPMMAAAPSTMR